eukprot:TRINITY_DN7592_c0_g1_i1.p1 TRINITY_DN7592_c0_g1~~TRINITY_DN7592_c0_g1_i1.p1  ORF type:complete len:469 (-),score=108.28 TRINITY_DN7592_c0_g1_i1:51-1457(-)
MFGSEHKGHEFRKLTDIYEQHVDKVRKEALLVRSRLRDLTTLTEAIETNIDAVTKAKNDRERELDEGVRLMKERLDEVLKSKLLTLLTQKSTVAEEIEMLDGMLSQLNLQITESPRALFVQKSDELTGMLRQIHEKPIAQFAAAAVSAHFPSDLLPSYSYGRFRLRSYSQIRGSKEVVYSEPLQAQGLTWRLKVYPNGNGPALSGVFLSVFVEMVRGSEEAAKYQYMVSLLHATDPTREVKREYTSEFEVGECWGYNRFLRLDNLLKDGYLAEDDSLQFSFAVRAVSYEQHCRDQGRYIQLLELQQSQLESRLRILDPPPPEVTNDVPLSLPAEDSSHREHDTNESMDVPAMEEACSAAADHGVLSPVNQHAHDGSEMTDSGHNADADDGSEDTTAYGIDTDEDDTPHDIDRLNETWTPDLESKVSSVAELRQVWVAPRIERARAAAHDEAVVFDEEDSDALGGDAPL